MIIDFIKKVEEKEPLIWRCDCGNCAFLIYQDGSLECSDCGGFMNGCDTHYMAVRRWTRKARDEG